MKRLSKWCLLLLVASILTGSWWAAADPILPHAKLSDEEVSLAHIRRFRIDPLPMPKALTEIGFDDPVHKRVLKKELEAADFVIGQAEDMPLMISRVVVNQDENHPKMLAIWHVVALRQKVRLERLDRRLFVPTASVSNVVLASREDAVAKLKGLMRQNLRTLKRTVDHATNVLDRMTEQGGD